MTPYPAFGVNSRLQLFVFVPTPKFKVRVPRPTLDSDDEYFIKETVVPIPTQENSAKF